MCSRGFLACTLILLPFYALAQIESVLVERYHGTREAGTDPLMTYRIYIDLEEGHILQSVYGDKGHTLTIGTSTTFYNDSVHGVRFGEQFDPNWSIESSIALDSWLAVGFCSDRHKAVPLHLDPDGSVFNCPPEFEQSSMPNFDPLLDLCEHDGQIPAERVPETVHVNLTTGYVDHAHGGLIESDNCAWGVLGGVKGATQDNMVLIAQLTTDGELYYALNVQVRKPNGEIVRCTATPTNNSEELHVPALRSSSPQ